jgi:SAF domain-containing protein
LTGTLVAVAVSESSEASSSEKSPKVMQALLINQEDNVAVALEAIPGGDEFTLVGGAAEVRLRARQAIPFAHKIAVRPIAKGEAILKYGVPVAVAAADIAVGDWVHTHNARSSFDA